MKVDLMSLVLLSMVSSIDMKRKVQKIRYYLFININYLFIDVNGIIQGEFGFITADGIYHVTVYATDENGNFRILSMKNIRISARNFGV